MKVMDTNILIKIHGQGSAFTYGAIKDFIIFSWCSSSNDHIDTLEQTPFETGKLIRTMTIKAIIAGDFEATSALTGTNFTDRRGQLLSEWITHNQVVSIKWNKHTCQIISMLDNLYADIYVYGKFFKKNYWVK